MTSNKVYSTISEKHNCFIWLLPRTGSNHMVTILKNYDFKHYVHQDDNKEIYDENLVTNHYSKLFDGHENYQFISSIRNPYSLEVSLFRMNKLVGDYKERFKRFIDGRYFTQFGGKKPIINFTRVPDFFIRMENLYEDYSKIPFIVNSDYYQSGELKKQVEIKINNNIFDDRDWRDFYDDESAEIVYSNNMEIFNLNHYDKDSYKI